VFLLFSVVIADSVIGFENGVAPVHLMLILLQRTME